MSDVLSLSPQNGDWLFVCDLADRQVWGDVEGMTQYLNAVAPPVKSEWVPNNGVAPSMFMAEFADFLLFSVTGTLTQAQWIGNVCGSVQVPSIIPNAHVSLFFQASAWYLYQQALAWITAYNKPAVFCGHSLGAACAQLMTGYALLGGKTVQACYAVASPNVGDTSFASYVNESVVTLQAPDDPIPSLPPQTWFGVSTLTLYGYALNFDYTYTPAGTPYTVDQYGRYTLGGASMGLNAAIAALASDNWRAHQSAIYKSRLTSTFASSPFNLVAGAQGYAQPWLLADREPPPATGSQGYTPPVLGVPATIDFAAEQKGCRKCV